MLIMYQLRPTTAFPCYIQSFLVTFWVDYPISSEQRILLSKLFGSSTVHVIKLVPCLNRENAQVLIAPILTSLIKFDLRITRSVLTYYTLMFSIVSFPMILSISKSLKYL